MKNFNKCSNGHYYRDTEQRCPYCPDCDIEIKECFEKNDFDKTHIVFDTENDKNIDAFEDKELLKTFVEDTNINSYRKIVGELLSSCENQSGNKYKIYEGRNSIGSHENNSVIIKSTDISSIHCTILFRNDRFRIKDEFSIKGTFVNDIEIDEYIILNDGDEIKIGDVILIFNNRTDK